MFIYKTQKEIAELDDTQVEDYATKLKAHEADLRTKEIETAVDAVKTSLTAEIAKATQANVDLETQIKELKDAQKGKADGEVTFSKEFEANKETIKNILGGQRGEVTIKAITNRASISGNTNAYVLPTIGQLGVKARALYDVLPKINEVIFVIVPEFFNHSISFLLKQI